MTILHIILGLAVWTVVATVYGVIVLFNYKEYDYRLHYSLPLRIVHWIIGVPYIPLVLLAMLFRGHGRQADFEDEYDDL